MTSSVARGERVRQRRGSATRWSAISCLPPHRLGVSVEYFVHPGPTFLSQTKTIVYLDVPVSAGSSLEPHETLARRQYFPMPFLSLFSEDGRISGSQNRQKWKLHALGIGDHASRTLEKFLYRRGTRLPEGDRPTAERRGRRRRP